MTRWALDRSRERAPESLRASIDRILGAMPIEKPQDHRGGPQTDCFRIDLRPDEVALLLATFDGETDSRMIHLGIVWREYRDAIGAAGDTMRGSESLTPGRS